MKKVWILEGWVTRERMEKNAEESERMLRRIVESKPLDMFPEEVKVFEELVEFEKKMLAEHPDGYWCGYEGKSNYDLFCQRARNTMRDMKDMKWRVLKAEISDDAESWGGYTNGVENNGVLRYLYATM